MTVGPRRLSPYLAAALASVAVGAAWADVVTTTDGKAYEGTVLSDDAERVVIETTFDGTKEFPKAGVRSVDTSTPPLRRQLSFRLDQAKDLPALIALLDWAKAKGFKDELPDVWKRVLTLDPANVKAHKALGHLLVGKVWMTPDEKAAAEAAALEAAFRAKGLVPYQGKWVTPADKEALEKGLLKDGDEWVTEEEFHLRRGESKVDGNWIRVGEAEAKAHGAVLSKELGETLTVGWSPHVDFVHDLEPAAAKAVLDATERTAAAFWKLMKPGAGDKFEGLRIGLHGFQKATTYARYTEWFAKDAALATMPGFENWGRLAGRIRGCHWWPKPGPMVASFVFPYTVPNLASFAAHHAAICLVSRYRYSLKKPVPPWLVEGLAYVLELEANGSTETFTVGRGGIAGGGDPGPWQESAKWKDALKTAVLGTQDTPFARLEGFAEEQLQLPDLVKSWSLVNYLIRLDRAKFKVYVDALVNRDTSADEALKQAYNLDARGFEARWRAWVEGGFQGP